MLPLTLASMVPNTVTPLPDEAPEAPAVEPAEPVPAHPATKAPIARANTAAMNDFTENSRNGWDCGPL